MSVPFLQNAPPTNGQLMHLGPEKWLMFPSWCQLLFFMFCWMLDNNYAAGLCVTEVRMSFLLLHLNRPSHVVWKLCASISSSRGKNVHTRRACCISHEVSVRGLHKERKPHCSCVLDASPTRERKLAIRCCPYMVWACCGQFFFFCICHFLTTNRNVSSFWQRDVAVIFDSLTSTGNKAFLVHLHLGTLILGCNEDS